MLDVMNTKLRPITAEDARTLYDWRTAPHVRAASFDSGELEFTDHLEWLSRTLRRMDGVWRIFEVDGRPVGTVNAVDQGDGSWRWGFHVGEDLRRGHATRMLRLMIEFLRMHGAQRIIAETLPGNTASERIHERLGFSRVESDPNRAEAHQRWMLALRHLTAPGSRRTEHRSPLA